MTSVRDGRQESLVSILRENKDRRLFLFGVECRSALGFVASEYRVSIAEYKAVGACS